MRTFTVFAFGSNLDDEQMSLRCPSAYALARATLPRHGLVFAGFSARWGGAVASLVRDPARSVPGLLYRVSDEDLLRLDRFEGHPIVYERRLKVVLQGSQRRRAHVYVLAPALAVPGLPSLEYLTVIATAYGRLGFDRRTLIDAATEVA